MGEAAENHCAKLEHAMAPETIAGGGVKWRVKKTRSRDKRRRMRGVHREMKKGKSRKENSTIWTVGLDQTSPVKKSKKRLFSGATGTLRDVHGTG